MNALKEALRALKRGDRTGAEVALGGDLQGEPAEAWLLRGLLAHKRDPLAAYADLRRGIAHQPSDVALLAQAAELLLEDKKLVDAGNALARLADLVSPSTRARVRRRLANLWLDLGRYREGIHEYRRAVELAPDAEQISRELVEHLRELGDFEAALEVAMARGERPPEILAKLERFDEAREAAREIATHRPDFAAAELFCQTGAFLEARALLARLEPALDVLLLSAELASWAGELVDARELVERALRLDPASARALQIRGTLSLLENETEAGERDLQKVLESNPDEPLALVWLGEVERRRENWEAAWTALGRGIEKTRGYPLGAHVSLVATHAGRDFAGDLDLDLYRELCQLLAPAFSSLGEATDAPQSNAEVSRRLEAVLRAMHGNRGPRPSYVHSGVLKPLDLPTHARFRARAIQELLRTRSHDWVLANLEALARERPSESTIQCHIGEVYLWLGDWSAAEASFLRAIELARETRWAYVGLCATELGKQNPEEAITWCERGEREAVPGRTLFAYRGEAHRLLGDRERARADLEKALELTPARLSAWLNLALVAGDAKSIEHAYIRLEAHAPGLVHDAASELGLPLERIASEPDACGALFVHALSMMRGNRASSFVTYFTRAEELRFVPPPGSALAIAKRAP